MNCFDLINSSLFCSSAVFHEMKNLINYINIKILPLSLLFVSMPQCLVIKLHVFWHFPSLSLLNTRYHFSCVILLPYISFWPDGKLILPWGLLNPTTATPMSASKSHDSSSVSPDLFSTNISITVVDVSGVNPVIFTIRTGALSLTLDGGFLFCTVSSSPANYTNIMSHQHATLYLLYQFPNIQCLFYFMSLRCRSSQFWNQVSEQVDIREVLLLLKLVYTHHFILYYVVGIVECTFQYD